MIHVYFPLPYENYSGDYEEEKLRETVKSLDVGVFLIDENVGVVGVMHPDGSVWMFSTQNDGD